MKILERHKDISLIETDKLDGYGLPIYTVQNGTKVRTFAYGELSFQDAERYYWDIVIDDIYGA